jgi:hypothetical protein
MRSTSYAAKKEGLTTKRRCRILAVLLLFIAAYHLLTPYKSVMTAISERSLAIKQF